MYYTKNLTMATLLEFVPTSDDINARFMRELKNSGISVRQKSNVKDEHLTGVQRLGVRTGEPGSSKLLSEIISEVGAKQKQLKITFVKTTLNTEETVYLAMVSCYADYMLIALGNVYNFPRGFPIIWIPGQLIQTYGFYPKFDNDAAKQEPDDDKSLRDIAKIQFFVKWSGYLGQLIVFTHQGVIYWTATSKNSGNSADRPDKLNFVKDCQRIWNLFLSTKALEYMAANQLHMCAEMLSKEDQKHGAVVKKEGPLVTMVGKGCIWRNTMGEPVQPVDALVTKTILDEVVNFCQRFQFPCGTAYTFSGPNAKIMLSKLSTIRDKMTNTKFLNLISETVGVHKEGTATHEEYLGEVLEGLVIHITHNDESKETKKYKFPLYTLRTMALREMLQDGIIMCSIEALEKFKNFCARWCVWRGGRKYIAHFLFECAILLHNNSPLDNMDRRVGLHIRVADHVLNNGVRPNIEDAYSKCSAIKKLPVTLIMDPLLSPELAEEEQGKLRKNGYVNVYYSGGPAVRSSKKSGKKRKEKQVTPTHAILIKRTQEEVNERAGRVVNVRELMGKIASFKRNKEKVIEITKEELMTTLNQLIISNEEKAPFGQGVKPANDSKKAGKLFVVLTGIPGVGKSFSAKLATEKLNAAGIETVTFSQDQFRQITKMNKKKNKLETRDPGKKAARNSMLAFFEDNLKKSTQVIISNRNNFSPRDRSQFIAWARKYNYRVVSIDPAELMGNTNDWAKLYLVAQATVHKRTDHETLNYNPTKPGMVAQVVQSFAGEYQAPSESEVDASMHLDYLQHELNQGFEKFNLEDEKNYAKGASFQGKTPISGVLRDLATTRSFPYDDLVKNRRPVEDIVSDMLRFISEQLTLSSDMTSAAAATAAATAAAATVPANTDFSIDNIAEVLRPDNLVITIKDMFLHTRTRQELKTFNTFKASDDTSNYSKDINEAMWAGYVVPQRQYQVLCQILKLLVPGIPLQEHFHMTVGFGKNMPNLNGLPGTVDATVIRVVRTKDNGLAAIELEVVNRAELGVADTKILHLTLGVNPPYKAFHSNTVLQVLKDNP